MKKSLKVNFEDFLFRNHKFYCKFYELTNHCFIGNMFSWDRDNLLEPPNGSLADMPTWEDKEYENFCQDETLLVPFDRYSPDELPFEEAVTFCRALGGKMAMPGSLEEELDKWKKFFSQDGFDSDEIKRRSFYLPLTDNDQEEVYVDIFTGKAPTYTNWGLTEPNGGTAENCAVIAIFNPRNSETK